MSKVVGSIKPIRDHILVEAMNFGEQKTAGGIVLRSDDGKSEGVKPRWCRVWAVGHEQTDVKVGEWLLVEHGRWTRGIDLEQEDGSKMIIRRVDPEGILIVTDDKPEGPEFGSYTTLAHGAEVRPEDFGAR
jgi:co-chaperonin GroES (HSP10)